MKQDPNSAVAFEMTPRGRGAVATICLVADVSLIDACESRPQAFQPVRGGRSADLPLGDAVFGQWGEGQPEDIVLCRVSKSVTEIHCHGGRAAVARILGDLESRGCRITTWSEDVQQTRRAIEAECLQALTQATTLLTATHVLAQQRALPVRLKELLSIEGDDLRAGLNDLLKWSDLGTHLTTPWSVVLCGRPNVGKSSLINALVGYRRAIVYDEPGTTRDIVQADTALDGWPIRFSDTAGLREEASELEQAGIARARDQIASANLLIVVIDGSQPIDPVDIRLLEDHPHCLVVVSKTDLPSHSGMDQFLASTPEAVPVSAHAGKGLERLQQAILQRLLPETPAVGAALPFTRRQVACLRAAVQAESPDESRRWVRGCLDGDTVGRPSQADRNQ